MRDWIAELKDVHLCSASDPLFTPELFEYLTAEKEKAKAQRAPVEVNFNGAKLHLEGHGGKGYHFIAKGGPLGANWFFKKPQRADPRGVRLTVSDAAVTSQ